MLEKDIQKQCLEWLKENGFLAWKQPGQGLRVSGGKRVKARGGANVGHPDIMALRDSLFYCIEVKTERGKVANAQIAFLTYAQMKGAVVMVVRSLEQMIEIIDSSESNLFIDTI